MVWSLAISVGCFISALADETDWAGFACPRGRYFNSSRLQYLEASRVLTAWQSLLHRRGYIPTVAQRGNLGHYMNVHTFESDAWNRPAACAGTALAKHANGKLNAEDADKEVCGDEGSALVSDEYRFIYRIVAKAGSNSLINYFKCNFGMIEVPCKDIGSWKINSYLHVASSRNPVKRFISGYRQILFQHKIFFPNEISNCASPQADKFWKARPKGRRLKLEDYPHDWFGNSGSRCHKEKAFLQQTEFYGIDPDGNPGRSFAAFIRDHQCQLEYFSSEHVASAASQSTGRVCFQDVFQPDFLFRIHNLEEDMLTFKRMVGFKEDSHEKCPLRRLNGGESEHKAGTLGGAFFENMLLSSEEMMQDLCVILFQDLLCFNYKFPFACSNMIKEAMQVAGVSPRRFKLFAEGAPKAVESDLM
jgi:hypothetical protein